MKYKVKQYLYSIKFKDNNNNNMKKNTILTIAQLWEACDKIKVFEIEVVDKRTNEKGYIAFNIEIDSKVDGTPIFRAEHVALSEAEENSPLVAFCYSEIDEDFSLDENLESLYDKCYNAICESEYYDQFYEEDVDDKLFGDCRAADFNSGETIVD